jgi:hypothetical protein
MLTIDNQLKTDLETTINAAEVICDQIETGNIEPFIYSKNSG